MSNAPLPSVEYVALITKWSILKVGGWVPKFGVDIIYKLLGSKELGINVLELYFVMLANHDQNVLVLFRIAQSICFLCKIWIELLQDLLCKSAWFDRSRIRLDQSKLRQKVFLQNFPTQPKLVWRVGFYVLP